MKGADKHLNWLDLFQYLYLPLSIRPASLIRSHLLCCCGLCPPCVLHYNLCMTYFCGCLGGNGTGASNTILLGPFPLRPIVQYGLLLCFFFFWLIFPFSPIIVICVVFLFFLSLLFPLLLPLLLSPPSDMVEIWAVRAAI